VLSNADFEVGVAPQTSGVFHLGDELLIGFGLPLIDGCSFFAQKFTPSWINFCQSWGYKDEQKFLKQTV